MNKAIFIHILKCGGTSMLYMLYQQHGVSGFYPVPISTVKDIVYYPHLRGYEALIWQNMIDPTTLDFYSCIAGHYDWTIAKRFSDWPIITILRHPVEQLKSLYQYMAREEKENYEIAKYLQTLGFDGWLQSEHIRPYLNGQTAYLSGHQFRNVETALANLQSKRVTFGLLERFADSIQLFNQKFDWQLQEQKRNVSQNVVSLTEDVYQEGLRLQADDMRLYQYALDNFEAQFNGNYGAATI